MKSVSCQVICLGSKHIKTFHYVALPFTLNSDPIAVLISSLYFWYYFFYVLYVRVPLHELSWFACLLVQCCKSDGIIHVIWMLVSYSPACRKWHLSSTICILQNNETKTQSILSLHFVINYKKGNVLLTLLLVKNLV